MCSNVFKGVTKAALAGTLLLGAGAVAHAEEQPEGSVVQIGKADEGTTPLHLKGNNTVNREVAVPKYWIGLAGAAIPPDHLLRAQVDLPEGQGLLVANVVPDSPAAKAGIKQHDILLRANDSDLHEMQNLVEIVSQEGDKDGKISIEILRKGKKETVAVTPEERPADVPNQRLGNVGPQGFNFGGGQLPEDFPAELLERFQGRVPFEGRGFEGGPRVGRLPDGVSVNIAREEGKPTQVTINRGDETWVVSSDDPESLEKVPQDLRPFVAQMLDGASPMDLHRGKVDTNFSNRLERLEKLMEKMTDQLENQNNAEESK